jgi:hypothetical protein
LKIKGATAEYVVEIGIENEGFSNDTLMNTGASGTGRMIISLANGFVQAITWTSSRAQLR